MHEKSIDTKSLASKIVKEQKEINTKIPLEDLPEIEHTERLREHVLFHVTATRVEEFLNNLLETNGRAMRKAKLVDGRILYQIRKDNDRSGIPSIYKIPRHIEFSVIQSTCSDSTVVQFYKTDEHDTELYNFIAIHLPEKVYEPDALMVLGVIDVNIYTSDYNAKLALAKEGVLDEGLSKEITPDSAPIAILRTYRDDPSITVMTMTEVEDLYKAMIRAS